MSCLSSWEWRSAPPTAPTSSAAASSSGLLSPRLWPTTRRSSWRTSPRGNWTRRRATRSSSCSSDSTRTCTRPRLLSPTTSACRASPTGSCKSRTGRSWGRPPRRADMTGADVSATPANAGRQGPVAEMEFPNGRGHGLLLELRSADETNGSVMRFDDVEPHRLG